MSSLLKFGSAGEDFTIRPVLAETNFPELAFLMATRGELVFIDVNVLRGEAFTEPTLDFLVPDFFDIIFLRYDRSLTQQVGVESKMNYIFTMQENT